MRLCYFYDHEADVLYFSQGKPSPRSTTREIADDVVLRLHPRTKKVTGFTILNFRKRLKNINRPVSLPVEVELTVA